MSQESILEFLEKNKGKWFTSKEIAKELKANHSTLINNIRSEYEHNLSQQIYISTPTWNLLFAVKEEIINLINTVAAKVKSEAPGANLSKAILETLLKSEQEWPTQRALNELKTDIKQLF